MRKRIALFVLGMVLAIGAFILYQHFTGASVGNGYKLKPAATQEAQTQPMVIERRDETGRLQYLITSPSSPEQVIVEGHTVPGEFVVKFPVATIFDSSGRTIEIRADTCDIQLAQGPGTAVPGLNTRGTGVRSTPTKLELNQVSGMMHGNVRLAISPRPADSNAAGAGGGPAAAPGAGAGGKNGETPDPLAEGLRMYFDGDVKLDGNAQRITTDDWFHIRSGSIEGDCRKLTLVFGSSAATPGARKNGQIQSLRIDENPNGNKLIVRHMGNRLMDNANGAAPGAPAAQAGRGAAAKPPAAAANPLDEPPTYRMSFGQNVLAATGRRSLQSERLFIIFKQSADLGPAQAQNAGAAGNAGPGGGVGMGEPVNIAPLGNIPAEAPPLLPPTDEDLVVTWQGALEMRPLDDPSIKLAGGNDVILEALGAGGEKPVMVHDERFEAQMGRLLYRPDHPIALLKEDFGKVILKDLNPTSRGDVECGDVSIDLKQNLVYLAGPGRMISIGSAADAAGTKTEQRTLVAWKDRMALALESLPDPADPKKTVATAVRAVRKATLYGATVNADTFDLAGDTLDVLVANAVKDGKMTQSLQHLLVTGNFEVRSYQKDKAGSRFEAGGMQGDRLEIQTAPPIPNAAPVPVLLLAEAATGKQVKAWHIQESGNQNGALAMAGNPPPVPAGTKPGIRTETIYTPHLTAELKSGAKSTSRPATTAPPIIAAATQPQSFAAMGQDVIVTHFVADDPKIEIKLPDADTSRLITATAGLLDAHPEEGRAMLTALQRPNQPMTPVRIVTGNNQIQGNSMDLKFLTNEQTFFIRGPGEAHFFVPAEKPRNPADKAKEPTPLWVAWKDSMSFDNLAHRAIFTGYPVAIVPSDQPNLADLAKLACDKTLTVQLKPAATASADPLGGGMSLEWMEAVGKVQAHGAQIGPRGEVLTDMLIDAHDTPEAPGLPAKLGMLRYTEADQAFEIPGPGALIIHDNRPPRTGEWSSQGTSGFGWAGGLTFDGKTNVIRFTRKVQFVHQPVRPFPFLSAQGVATATTAPATRGSATKPQDIAPAILQTDELIAYLKNKPGGGPAATTAPADRTVASPIGLGNAGNLDLARVEALNGAHLQVADYTMDGYLLTFVKDTNIATITGKGEDLMRFSKGKNSVEGTSATLDMSKNSNFLDVKNLRGDINSVMPAK